MSVTLHSRVSPSGMHLTVKCTGSLLMQEAFPSVDTDATEDGTLSHGIAASMLMNVKHVDADIDIVSSARFYADYVKSVAAVISVERQLPLPNIHKDCYGTPDAYAVSGKTLHIFDYKYGLIQVDAYENWQCLCYASNALNAAIKNIVIHVIQPRNYLGGDKIKTWNITIDQLKEYVEYIRKRVIEALHAPVTTSGMHCVYCSARIHCLTFHEKCVNIIKLCGQINTAPLEREHIDYELPMLQDALKMLKSRVEALELQVENDIRAGIRYKNYGLKNGRGGKKWRLPDSELLKLGDSLGIDLRAPEKLLSPAQALKKNLNVKGLYAHKPGALKLERSKYVD